MDETKQPGWIKRWGFLAAVILVTAIATALIAALLMNIYQRKQEAKNPYLKIVEVTEETTDPLVWAANWPMQYDMYKKTVDSTRTKFGGSEAMPQQKLDRDPWLKRMYAGYAFSIDYRDRRGHAYMLYDQEQTERVKQKAQPGACLQCHASVIPTYRRLGGGDVMKGFEMLCAMTYQDAHAELLKTPDGSPDTEPNAHPVSCVDCHNPDNMELRVTRPGFINGIKALKKKHGINDYDPNGDATRQEMRSFVCGQCHVEYYFRGEGKTVTYPWANGTKVEEIEFFYDDIHFSDWKHGETGAPVLKAQHPEFEMWSQGVHARAGVACADCHMPYFRQGAIKISDHHVRSPLLMINQSCQVCHRVSEDELKGRVDVIQARTHDLMQRSSVALTDMLDAINLAKTNGATEEQLKPALALQRKAQWRLDFVSSENSMGFHAPQESARILGESIDYSRQGQVEAQKLVLEKNLEPGITPQTSVEGVTPATKPSEP